MADHRYIWCRKCGAVHHVSAFDREPVYVFAGGEVEELPANDWRAFMNRHAGHRLEALEAAGEGCFPDGNAFDPMSTSYVHVSNGRETLLLRRSRSTIDEPFSYEIIEGQFVQSGESLEIQAEAICKEMKLHFSWAPAEPLSDAKIARFVALFAEVVRVIDPRTICSNGYSDVDDNITYCPLNSVVVNGLLEKCGLAFAPNEVTALRRFIETHGDADDVMALIKRRRVLIDHTTS